MEQCGPTSSHRERRKVLRGVAITITAFVLVLVLPAILGVYDITAPYRYHRQLVDRLEPATDRDSVDGLVGPLGVVLDHPDGTWTAITYKDAHNFGHPSVAVARTSDGRWFDSRDHHCGLFQIYSGVRADQQAIYYDVSNAEYWKDRDARLALLHQIKSESDPVRRAQLLANLGFQVLR